MCTYHSHLQLMCLRVSWLERYLLLIAQASKVPIFIAGHALKLSSRTFKTFDVFRILTLGTSVSSLMCSAWIKSWLVGWSLILVFTWTPLVTPWFNLMGILFLLGFAWWEVSSLMPHEITLCCLGVTCNCFDVSSGWLWRLHLLGKLPHCACRKHV